jgi:lipopolysaccharide biosynthesis protein
MTNQFDFQARMHQAQTRYQQELQAIQSEHMMAQRQMQMQVPTSQYYGMQPQQAQQPQQAMAQIEAQQAAVPPHVQTLQALSEIKNLLSQILEKVPQTAAAQQETQKTVNNKSKKQENDSNQTSDSK